MFRHVAAMVAAVLCVAFAGEFALAQNADLAEDIGETNDLSETMPEKAKQLDLELSKWLIGVGAKMPQMNLDSPP